MPSKYRAATPVLSRIGVVFLLIGVFSLIYSVYYTQAILAFVGLGFTFWGVLFLLVAPSIYVPGSLLFRTAVSSYMTLDRLIRDLKYTGKGFYIPSYPKDAYLPDYLKGWKDETVFIPAEANSAMPSIEKLAEGSFVVENPDGVLVSPPGIGLLTQIERESKIDLTKTSINELCEILPKFIVEKFSIAKEMEMRVEGNQVMLRIFSSLFEDLYSDENNIKSISVLGCPIASAVACAIAKASGRTVAIQEIRTSLENSTTQVSYSIIQG